jgi:phosphatidate cytidylyltransferase
MKLKENLVYNFNRLFVGASILLVLFITYFFNLDILLYFSIIFFIFYEFYKSILKSKYLTLFLFVLFIFEFLSFHYLINNLIFLIIIAICFLILSIYSNKHFNIFFVLFVINILIIIPNLSLIDRNIIYLIISISFINDTIAYIVGSYVKGPLISPKISPKKTWSGTSFSFLITTIILIYLDFNLFIAPIMSISLFYGDIYFSYIKRKLSIKDFSRLLSSHGGILDRFDSITFLIIIFALLNF